MNVGVTVGGRLLAAAGITYKDGALSIYSGTMPASPETPLSGNTLLAQFIILGPTYDALVGGNMVSQMVFQFNPVTILASGTATFARVTAPAWASAKLYDFGRAIMTSDGFIAFCTQAGTSSGSGTGPLGAFLSVSSSLPDGTANWSGYGVPGPGLIDLTVGTSATDIIIASTALVAGGGNTVSLTQNFTFPVS